MTTTTLARTCERCAVAFVAQRRTARFCGEACRKAAARERTRAGRPRLASVRPWTIREALEEIDSMLELLPRDIATLEARHPIGADPVVDELIGGLATHEASLVRLRAWLVAR